MSTQQPLVSIVIPAYNVAPWIGKAIDSALKQTHQNLEVVVVDDASTDDTVTVVSACTDSRVRLIRHTANQGRGAALNTAIRETKGEWIAMLDADDWFDPRRVEIFLDEAQRCNADMLIDDQWLVDVNAARPWGKRFDGLGLPRQPTTISMDLLLDKPTIGIAKPFLKAEFIRLKNVCYRTNYAHCEDFLFLIDSLLAGCRVWLLPEPHYYALARQGSMMSGRVKHTRELTRILTDLEEHPPIAVVPKYINQIRTELDRIRDQLRYQLVTETAKQGQWQKAFMLAVKDPYFFLLLPTRLPRMTSTRFKRWLARLGAP